MMTPVDNSSPSNGAAIAVAVSDTNTPRIVFDAPNSGRPSGKRIPQSIGRPSVPRSILVAMTGAPFAKLNNTSSFNNKRNCMAVIACAGAAPEA